MRGRRCRTACAGSFRRLVVSFDVSEKLLVVRLGATDSRICSCLMMCCSLEVSILSASLCFQALSSILISFHVPFNTLPAWIGVSTVLGRIIDVSARNASVGLAPSVDHVLLHVHPSGPRLGRCFISSRYLFSWLISFTFNVAAFRHRNLIRVHQWARLPGRAPHCQKSVCIPSLLDRKTTDGPRFDDSTRGSNERAVASGLQSKPYAISESGFHFRHVNSCGLERHVEDSFAKLGDWHV